MTAAAVRGVLLMGLAGALTTPAIAGRFGDQRLFTTPEQRERMEARADDAAGATRRSRDGSAADADTGPDALVLKGIVRRPEAVPVFWLGGHRLRDGQAPPADLPVRRARVDGDGVVVTLRDGRRIRLEPGESLRSHALTGAGDAR